tara:strand:- start:1749 stop:2030 length:282 start_codon:yes stop_codon:yes gene_type:complete
MNSLLFLIVQIISLYKFILIIYIIATWLINFNIINPHNRIVYALMEALYRLSEPSLRIIRKFIPNLGNIDISPIIVFILLEFLQRLILEYWPK